MSRAHRLSSLSVAGTSLWARLLAPAAALAAVTALLHAGIPHSHAHSDAHAAAATTFTVAAGGESKDMAVQVNEFLPGTVVVNVGDTVTWRIQSTEFHTVTFLSGAPAAPFEVHTPDGHGMMVNPLAAFPAGGATYDGTGVASSGLLNKGQEYSLTFTAPGIYEYVCLVHPDMRGQIEVRPTGAAADSPAAVEAKVQPRVHEVLATHGLPIVLRDAHVAAAEGRAHVVAGDGDQHVSLLRFIPGDLTVRVGEPVTFTNRDPEMVPHTITFRAGGPAPEVITPLPQAGGPPLLAFNPEVLEPRGTAEAYDGEGYLNSGFLLHGTPNESFTVTFTQPGTYEYVCVLHEQMGMKGTITVLP